MNLLDTHVLVWAVNKPDLLSIAARRTIEQDNFVISAASLWEMIGKKGRASAPVDDPLSWWKSYIPRQKVLSISPEAIEYLDVLPGPNWDPFDRILMAQCIVGGLRLVTKDRAIRDHYQGHLHCVW